jgi:hypothetical protein
MAVCVGPPDVIVKGSMTVMIGSLPAARMGDQTAHGGVIVLGEMTVMIGDSGHGSAGGGGGAGSGPSGTTTRPPFAPGPGMMNDFATTFTLAGPVAAAFTSAAESGAALVSVKPPIGGKGPYPGCAECNGVGSLGKPDNLKEFVKEFKAAMPKWKDLSVDQRRDKLLELANHQLKKSGAPSATIASADRGGSGNAEFNPANWRLTVDRAALDKPALDDKEQQQVASAVFHEARHGEQFYLMAKNLASQGKSAADIASAMPGMDRDTIKAAVEDAKTNKIKPDEAKCAAALWEDFYGTGAVKRDRVTREILAAQKKEGELAAKANAANADASKTYEQKVAAYNDWKVAKDDFDAKHAAYTSLPIEADPWHHSNAAMAGVW